MMNELVARLLEIGDPEYKAFNDKLANTNLPTIGIRVPVLRKLAKDYFSKIDEIFDSFNGRTPYYEEILTLGIVLSKAKMELSVREDYIFKWLEFVDSWALTDTSIYQPKANEKTEYFNFLAHLSYGDKEFYIRYGAVGLFKYVDDDPLRVLEVYKGIHFGAYYVDMAVAWGLCEILVKAYDIAIGAIENKIFPPFVHNKAIQKAVESFRISDEQKEYLKSLKVKKE